jgi:hypothetical protein
MAASGDAPLWVAQSRADNRELREVMDSLDALYDPAAHEILMRHEGMVFYIACPERKDSLDPYASIMLFHRGYQEVGSFTMSVGDASHDGPLHAGDQRGVRELLQALRGIRESGVSVAFEGHTLTFPQSNITSVLPSPEAAAFPCQHMNPSM